jgi:hypothetical protein
MSRASLIVTSTVGTADFIILGTTNLCAQIDVRQPEYVFFTGGIAGISDSSPSEGDPKSLDRRTDVVELDGDRINRV